MTRSDCVQGWGWCSAYAALMLLAVALFGLAGCSHSQQTRAKSEDENDRYGVKTVGEVTSVGNAEPVALGGVGLVTGLDGSGGETPPNGYRTMLEDDLRKAGVKNIKELLSSPNNAIVIVEAQLPPGAHKGEDIEVEVKLPPGSRATSLRGGYLQKCSLYNYDFAKNLSPTYKGPDATLRGHRLAHAEGAILVGVGLADGEEGKLKAGRIWNGAKTLVDQPFGLMMNSDKQYASVAGLVTERINETFQAGLRGAADSKVADFKNNVAVALRVPPQYKLNLPRYLRVVRLIPLRNVADTPGEDPNDRRTYRQKLATDLLDPARTVTVALRLEALGAKSIMPLKKGLESKDPLVRFCSAEALAYLGSPSCGEELAAAVKEQPLFRAYGLAALASLNESVCQKKLQDLLQSVSDDETRYGAFRALHTLDERNPFVRGEYLNDSFWLHKVPVGPGSLVHICSVRRAEVVLFGDDPMLKPPFSFLAGEFAITATEDDHRCMVSRFPPRGGSPLRKQCSLKLDDVIRTMADLGAMYPEVVVLLQQAHSCDNLSARVRCDALPQAASVYELVKIGKGEAPEDLVPPGQDLGATPTLYALGVPGHTALERDQEAMQRDKQQRGKQASQVAETD